MTPWLSRVPRESYLSGWRGRIHRAIQESPGINYVALGDKIGARYGALQYNLSVLERLGYVDSFKVGRFRRYYCVGGRDHRLKRIDAYLHNRAYRETMEAVSTHPGASNGELAEMFPEVTRQTVSYRLDRLQKVGAVESQPGGRSRFYYATMDGGYVLDHSREPATLAVLPPLELCAKEGEIGVLD